MILIYWVLTQIATGGFRKEMDAGTTFQKSPFRPGGGSALISKGGASSHALLAWWSQVFDLVVMEYHTQYTKDDVRV